MKSRNHLAVLLGVILCAKRPRQEEIPMEGAGVSGVKDKKLEEWGHEFVDIRDKKAALAEELTGLETKMLDRMTEKGIAVFRFADQELRVKPGKTHVKIKTVKNDGVDDAEGDAEPKD